MAMARCIGKEYGNVLLRKEQYRISDSPERSHCYARNMIIGKIYNCCWCMERTLRDHRMRVEEEVIVRSSKTLQEMLERCRESTDLEQLRGIGGEGSGTILFGI